MVGSKVARRTRAGASVVGAPPAAVGVSPREYFPGLDGLRAIAVVAVLLFHAEVADAPGGFLGVSLFFTLSGFLITGLLIRESAVTGRVALRRFWGRRVRRLMPAALLCLGLVLAGSRWFVARAAIPRLRIDVVAAASNVANWRFVTAHQSYAELFARQPSAVLHFWSLAIEEQFYLIFPCVVAVLVSRRRAWALPHGLLVMTTASVIASVMTSSPDVVYYGTHTRAAELLIGGLLACAIQRRAEVARWRSASAAGARIVQAVGFVGCGVLVLLVVTTRQSDGWLYRGGFAALALLWCALIVAARAAGPFRALVSQRPLVALGRRSYGVYLFHWPVFTLLTPTRLGVDGWPARLIQLLIVGVLTEASYRLIERPIRHRTILVGPRRAPAMALGCVAAVIGSALVLPSSVASTAGSQLTMVDAPDEVVHLAAVTPTTVAAADGPDRVADAPVPKAVSSPTPRNTVTATAPGAANMVLSNQSSPSSQGPSVSLVPAAPALNVVVIGGSREVAAPLLSFRDSGSNIAVDDLTAVGCTVVAVTADGVGDGGCVPTPSDRGVVDVLVVGIGPADHQAIADAVAATPGEAGTEVFATAENVRLSAVAEFESLGRRAAKVILVDTVPSLGSSGARMPDVLDTIIDEAVLSTPSLSRVGLADLRPAAVGGSVTPMPGSAPAQMPADVPLKVMVIGDSTSYGIAQGLAGSTAAPFDVLWAGKRNCPIARMDSIRWLTGDEFSMADCPSVTSVWPEQIDSFRPDVVLVVDGLPEQSLQRYAGDADWHDAGDAQFVAAHAGDFRALLDLVAAVGSVVILADQPHNADGAVAWATTARIDAWNAQLASWDAQWAPVAMLPYGHAVEAAEAAAGHSLRPDGLHLDESSVAAIVGGVLAPSLRAQVIDLHAALGPSGCLVGAAGRTTFDLTRCG